MWGWGIALAGAAGLGALLLRDDDDSDDADELANPNPPPARPRRMRKPLPRTFDDLFDKYRGEIPIEYMRALAWRESQMNPNDTHGPAWGLMQVVPIALRAFNKRHGTSLSRPQLLDPDVNVAIAADTLHEIIRGYRRRHSDVLAPDWSSKRFVELITSGWNAGWSQRRGLMRVVSWLKMRNLPVAVDTVHRHASEAGGIRFLSEDKRLRWWKSVADLYLLERAREHAREHAQPVA